MNEAVLALENTLGPLAELVQNASLPALSPDDLLRLVDTIEDAGRAVDALRAFVAGEVAERSRPQLGTDGLAYQRGCANGMDLLERVTRAPRGVLARRVRLARLTRTGLSITGEVLPSRFPSVTAALGAGQLGVDAALTITSVLATVRGASPEDMELAERSLVAGALGEEFDEVPAGIPCTFVETEKLAARCLAYLDPDGVLPAEEEALKSRGVAKTFSRDDLVNYRLKLIPEVAGAFEALLDAYASPRTRAGFPSAEEQAATDAADAAGEVGDIDGEAARAIDPRTLAQKRHDILAGIINEASRSDTAPHLGGDYPTVLVTISATDLATGRGAGRMDGIDLPVSAKAVGQMVCGGGFQLVVVGEGGKLVALHSKQRCFTAQQRRAITARDGGCIIPGCTVPARKTEVHHVHEASRGGPTDCANGVLLCWFHHRTIDTSGWLIQMRDGVPWVKAPPWLGGYARANPWRRARHHSMGRGS